MAPTTTFTTVWPQEHLHLSHKIRKPLVEKMRRDRINNSIEELKALLGPQLLGQQPDSKMEKADILEMTVCLLRRQLQSKITLFPSNANRCKFNKSGKELANILFEESGGAQTQGRLQTPMKALNDDCKNENRWYSMFSAAQQYSEDKKHTLGTPWRPW